MNVVFDWTLLLIIDTLYLIVFPVLVLVLFVVVAVMMVMSPFRFFLSFFSPSFLPFFTFSFCLLVPFFPTPHFLSTCCALMVTNAKCYTLSCFQYRCVVLLPKTGSITLVHRANQPAVLLDEKESRYFLRDALWTVSRALNAAEREASLQVGRTGLRFRLRAVQCITCCTVHSRTKHEHR